MGKTKLKPAGAHDAPRSYSPEFKLEAVKRLRTTTNATALALELGVRRNRLYKWSKQLEKIGVVGPLEGMPVAADVFKNVGRPPVEAEDELSGLRRENKRLELENAILKKAEAYFARPKR